MAKNKLLSLNDLRDRGVPYHRVHIARLERAGKFPRRVRLNDAGRVAWVESRIREAGDHPPGRTIASAGSMDLGQTGHSKDDVL